jgi:hypothetical protein
VGAAEAAVGELVVGELVVGELAVGELVVGELADSDPLPLEDAAGAFALVLTPVDLEGLVG